MNSRSYELLLTEPTKFTTWDRSRLGRYRGDDYLSIFCETSTSCKVNGTLAGGAIFGSDYPRSVNRDHGGATATIKVLVQWNRGVAVRQ